MAGCLLNNPSHSTFLHPSSPPNKPSQIPLSKTLKNFPISTRPSQSLSQSQSLLSLALPSPSRASRFRPVYKSHSTAHDSVPLTNERKEADNLDEVKGPTTHADPKSPLPSVETLIIAYKKAVLAEDENSILEIEGLICRIENGRDEFKQKYSTLSTEFTSGKEKYIRLQADFDNFRKRTEKESLSIRSDAQQEVIESLLPMVDSFERAKQQIRPETEKETKIDTSYQGIYKQLVEIMRSLRVAAVATVGKPFDPSLHEAIAREESEKFKEGIVIQELRRGFLLDGRLMRPAMVKVSKGLREKKTSTTAASENTMEEQPVASGGRADEN